MQLSFLGQAYEAIQPEIAATATPETATFLGKRYRTKQFTVTQHQGATTELTYRGVRYSR